jgi:hypothetical protein
MYYTNAFTFLTAPKFIFYVFTQLRTEGEIRWHNYGNWEVDG